MVASGDFEVHLVYADTKTPLREHEKDGKVYAEAEPDAEYFIAIRRRGNSGPRAILTDFYVDGKQLKHHRWWTRACHDFSYDGMYSRTDGHTQQTALQFKLARAEKDKTDGKRFAEVMGKVEVKIFEAIPEAREALPVAPQTPPRSQIKIPAATVTPDACVPTVAGVGCMSENFAKKKFILSVPGTTSITKPITEAHSQSHTKGHYIDTITLYYCSAVGLIEVGVLPKPPGYIYVENRSLSSISTGSQQRLRRAKRVRHCDASYNFMGSKEADLFELSSDEED
jgi:hypothetical protein